MPDRMTMVAGRAAHSMGRPQTRVMVGVTMALAFVVLAPVCRAAIVLDALVVRVYDNAGVRAADRSAALKQAAEILFRAEIDVEWLTCPARSESWACARPPSPQEIIVRLTNSPLPEQAGARRVFGHSAIAGTPGEGILATVYVDRVNWLAGTATAQRTLVLGRAIAHEIGHLMLSSNEHTATGLMREVWTAEELVRNRPEDWQFSAAQITHLQTRLARPAATRSTTRKPKSSTPPGPRS